MEFACFPCVCVGFLWVFQFPANVATQRLRTLKVYNSQFYGISLSLSLSHYIYVYIFSIFRILQHFLSVLPDCEGEGVTWSVSEKDKEVSYRKYHLCFLRAS